MNDIKLILKKTDYAIAYIKNSNLDNKQSILETLDLLRGIAYNHFIAKAYIEATKEHFIKKKNKTTDSTLKDVINEFIKVFNRFLKRFKD